MTRVTLGKSRVRESRMPGSVRAKAEWLRYSTATRLESRMRENRTSGCVSSEGQHVQQGTVLPG
jgi:hypothetical protein